MDRPASNRPPSLKKVLALVRKSARDGARTSTQLPEFNRLFRFYFQFEADGFQATGPPNDEPTQQEIFVEETEVDRAIDAELTKRTAQQQAVQALYLDYPGYYALLTSFYTAFIAPLEQDIAIAEACEELKITALEVGPRHRRVLLPVRRSNTQNAPETNSFNWRTAQSELAGITAAFAALGTLLSPAFTLTDFMRDARSQDQDNF